MKTMLCVFAHPDDESILPGGTIAKYAQKDWNITLVTLSRGEAGRAAVYMDSHPDELGNIRAHELDKAARLLGISTVKLLEYPDGKLSEVPVGEMEDRLTRMMLEYSPHVVITHDTTGHTNHPDHIKVSYAATYAFQRYIEELSQTRDFVRKVSTPGEPVMKRHFFKKHMFALKQETFADVVDSKAQPKLYYACLPESTVLYFQKCGILPKESFDKPVVGIKDRKVTTVINISQTMKQKIAAIRAHDSQMAKRTGTLLTEYVNRLPKNEFFVLRYHGELEVYMGNADRVSDRL